MANGSSSTSVTTLAQAFDLFRRTIEMKKELIQRINAQEKPLREGLQKRWPGAEVFFTGSYGRSTKIEPITDVDVFLVRPEQFKEIGKITLSRDTLMAEVKAELQKLFPQQFIRQQTRSLGIQFQDFRIDVVPAVKRTGGAYFISDNSPGTADWRFTNPKKQAEFTAQVDRTTQQMATPLTKMMKVWNREQRVGLKSFHVEVMVLRALSAKPASYAEGVKLLFEKLEHAIKKSCGDPGESGGKVDDYLDLRIGARGQASAQAKRAADQMKEALALVTLKREAEAIRLVGNIFGAPFPRG